MSKPRVIVLSVVEQRLSVSEAAVRFGVSRQWVHTLLVRYRDGGLDAVEPRSHRPHSNPRQTSPELAERIVAIRRELTAHGLDAGPLTIAARLRSSPLAPMSIKPRRAASCRWLGRPVAALGRRRRRAFV
jgi:transposase-like protein